MHVIFCNDPLQRNRVDVDFEREREAAKNAGLATSLLDFEALLSGNLSRALRDIEAAGDTVYRGWMLRVEQYATLYEALAARGALLINDPAATARWPACPSRRAQQRSTVRSARNALAQTVNLSDTLPRPRPVSMAPAFQTREKTSCASRL